MNYYYNNWQAASSSPSFSPEDSSLSPPSSTNQSADFNLTTSSFSHYASTSTSIHNNQIPRHVSDNQLTWRHHPYERAQKPTVKLERRSPFIYRHTMASRRPRSPIKMPVVSMIPIIPMTSMNDRPARCPLTTNTDHRSYPTTPRNKWKKRHRESSCIEETQQIAITIPRSILDKNRRSESSTQSRSDEGFCASEENQAEMDFDDGRTDFMNATDKIYENLRLQQQYPTAQMPRYPPPDTRTRIVVEDDEPSVYGRLTALLLSNARSNPRTRCKIAQAQAEIKALLQIYNHIELCVEDEMLFSRNCALFGHQVASQLRFIDQLSSTDFQRTVKKLHKLLYVLKMKKRNVILGSVGNFVQKIMKMI